MKIYHIIEEAHIEVSNLTPELRWEINQAFSQDQWVQATKYWLRGISNQHSVIGKLLGQMRDICWDYDRWDSMTTTQCLFLSNNLIDHWDQISYEARSWATM